MRRKCPCDGSPTNRSLPSDLNGTRSRCAILSLRCLQLRYQKMADNAVACCRAAVGDYKRFPCNTLQCSTVAGAWLAATGGPVADWPVWADKSGGISTIMAGKDGWSRTPAAAFVGRGIAAAVGLSGGLSGPKVFWQPVEKHDSRELRPRILRKTRASANPRTSSSTGRSGPATLQSRGTSRSLSGSIP